MKNKSWDRKAAEKAKEAKKQTMKELASFIKKTVRQELNAFHGTKRKADDDSPEEGELNACDEDGIDFAAFDYQDMNNLKISSDDDESEDEDEVSI